MISVRFGVPAEVAFAFLVDPANRPLWQSSLRRVEDVTPAEPAVGQTWTDVTAAGVRPAMETTELVPSTRWTERGSWHGIIAELTLHVEPVASGCIVTPEFRVRGKGLLSPLGPMLTSLARLAVPGDLRRAAGLLAREHG
ncbi:SRPBCC family protein [Nocardioides marmorisolisilvae]|uniref:SRPBCC family protein n=1 Tax=Nocardioides marmorisolisilvae TaxID=1542737 RepID=A0A3N0DQC8_9ACTN|nr:SRPBCC family protein [Nocardioides marmorisolisilvae]RNL77666.1 SRPBCC family protein [Nocardioides marmorisolisilvae]